MSNRERDESDQDVYPSDYNRGVISGEATPPDEHTRRVQALKRARGEAVPEPTVLQVHDEATKTQVPAAPDPAQQRVIAQARAEHGRTSRGGVTHDSPTMATVPATSHPALTSQGAARPEVAVPAHGASSAKSAAPSSASPGTKTKQPVFGAPSASVEPSSAEPSSPDGARASQVAVPVVAVAADGSAAPVAEQPRTSELAERSRKERRRERDRRAEKTAIRAVVIVFILVGVGLYAVLQSDLLNGPEEEGSGQVAKVAPKPRPKPVTTSQIDETPDLPALRLLAADGLTVVAEGLPNVEVVAGPAGQPASVAAAVESCRFAFAVWEFSPNKRFRFITTCQQLEGQILVGAYEVQGSKIRMSPLTDAPSTMTTTFEVEKPSKMTTEVTVAGERAVVLGIEQRVTTMRGGLQGEAFRDTYAGRNTLQIPGARPRAAEGAAGGKSGKDPLFELLKKKE